MDEKLAATIINEAKSGGIQTTTPLDKGELIKEANVIVMEAHNAYGEGAKGEIIMNILRLAGYKFFDSIDTHNDELPIPPELKGELPVLPMDLTAVDTVSLRRLHSQFHACLARANWMLAEAEANEYREKNQADLIKAQKIKELSQTPDPVTGKERKPTTMEAEAAGDEEVRFHRGKQSHWYTEAKLIKALRDTYQQTCERISREYTMRQGEV